MIVKNHVCYAEHNIFLFDVYSYLYIALLAFCSFYFILITADVPLILPPTECYTVAYNNNLSS